MGLANLVPGISGGTMLLAAGVYADFVDAIAQITTLKFRIRPILTLSTIVLAAGLSILLLAGLVKGLVVDHRWVMNSLFIGLTLGGVPVVLRRVHRIRPSFIACTVLGIVAMVIMATLKPASAGSTAQNPVMLFIAGIAGASAMVVPGISGAYLLQILGQYLPILASIDRVKLSLRAQDIQGVFAEMSLVIPVGLGVVIGIVVVSNLIRWLLLKHNSPTLGVVLGLILGSVAGLWPFQEAVVPVPGNIIKGQQMTPQLIAELDAEDIPTETFTPAAGQVAGSLGLIILGLGVTLLIAKMDTAVKSDDLPEDAQSD